MRTYSRAHFEEAAAQWAAGEFSDEWKPYRHAAAMHGFIYPPEGTRWDNWGDDEPTQRAVLIRAIREQPVALMAAINRSKSWHDVIEQVIAANESMAQGVTETERHDRHDRMDAEPTQRQAAEALRTILGKLPA